MVLAHRVDDMNLTGLLTDWEVDVVVEGRAFGAAMEEMFEGDLTTARAGGPH